MFWFAAMEECALVVAVLRDEKLVEIIQAGDEAQAARVEALDKLVAAEAQVRTLEARVASMVSKEELAGAKAYSEQLVVDAKMLEEALQDARAELEALRATGGQGARRAKKPAKRESKQAQ